eukprot:m.296103 g.296103  ORF g.296103 m.296103 type:complete len:148 (-) comp16273_c0_seq18:62-505(-)
MMVLELCNKGALIDYVKVQEADYPTLHLLALLKDVAKGMEYLMSRDFVVRPLCRVITSHTRTLLLFFWFQCRLTLTSSPWPQHRDLAARNVLLHDDGFDITAKVSDFGLGRQTLNDDYYRMRNERMLVSSPKFCSCSPSCCVFDPPP